jgi:hypothetical protein
MTFCIITLFCLYFIWIAHGVPIHTKISRPVVHADEKKSLQQGINPELRGGGLEGDMIFPKNSTRGVAMYGGGRWPGGIIPYNISAITGKYAL